MTRDLIDCLDISADLHVLFRIYIYIYISLYIYIVYTYIYDHMIVA